MDELSTNFHNEQKDKKKVYVVIFTIYCCTWSSFRVITA